MDESASDAVREALRLFRTEVDRRLASLDRGEGIDGDEVFARIRQKSKELFAPGVHEAIRSCACGRPGS